MNHFDEIDLIAPIQKALETEGYVKPTPIQAQTVPAALQGFDVLGCAQTGTGKTAAFALPILNRLGDRNRKSTPNRPLVLALAPTRELAIQIGDSFATYGRHLKIRQALVYGGVNQNKQVRAMDRGAHVLVATPGRLLDLMDQGFIHLDRLETFVLDEADRMLDMGFLPDLKRIIRCLPQKRQSLFFSATLPPNIIQLSQSLLTDPVTVNVTPKSRSVDKISQEMRFVEPAEKQSRLREILDGENVRRAIVFTRTKRTANLVERKLAQSGIKAAAIHGNKSQNARQRVLDAFRRDRVKVLVATDVAARGIDVDGITHVVNFDVPTEPESYVHRIGRTGRAGAEGIAITFYTSDQRKDVLAIEKLIGKKLLSDDQRRLPQRGKRPHRQSTSPRRNGSGSRPSNASNQRKRPRRQGRNGPRRVKQTT